LHYLRRRDKDQTGCSRGASTHLATVEQARLLHQSGGITRWCLEAALLAGESFAEAAQRCGLPVPVAECYSKVFFDVADKLEAKDYLCHRLFPRMAWQGFPSASTATLLKIAAWIGGPRVLDVAIRALTAAPVSYQDLQGMQSAELLREAEHLHCRLTLLLRALPLSAFLPPRVAILWWLAEDVDALFVELQEECRPDPVEQARVDALAFALPAASNASAAPIGKQGPSELGQRLVALHEAVTLLHDLASAA
jgi:hypothetical protein